MTIRILGGMPDRVHYAFDGSIAVAQGDLLYYDADDVKPASSQADGGSQAANQATFAPNFAGIANMARLSTDGAVTLYPVLTDVEVDISCDSNTWEVGDKITVIEASSGTALENLKVTKTTNETLAIGYCTKREASAVTTVRARLISRVTTHQPAPDVTAQLTSATLPVLIFNGATGANEIRVPTNLADALSLESTAGDIVVVDTTTGAVAITITTSAAAGLTLAGHVTVGDAKNVILNATTGTKIGTATGQKLGFWNATPVVQPTHVTDPAATAQDLTDNTGGTASGAGAIANLADGTTYANDHAAIENNFSTIVAEYNKLKDDVEANNSAIDSILSQLADTGMQAAA